MKWETRTSTELAALDRNIPVILPIAAIEQHGPHLPLATDSMIADHFMDQINKAIPDGVLTLPTIRVACSEHHMQFAGTLTSRHESFLHYSLDILTSVLQHGFKNLIVFNCHGGNLGIGQVLLESIGYRYPQCSFVLITWWKLIATELAQLQESEAGGVGHACEFETSLLLNFAPEHVREDQIPTMQTNVPTYDWAEGDMLQGSQASFYRRMDEMTPNGVYGAPFLATAYKGLAISRLVTHALKNIVADLSTK